MANFIRKRLRSASCVLLVLSVLFTIFIYFDTSTVIPGHFDYSGNIDGNTKKSTIIFLPLLALFIFITFSLMFRYPQLTTKQSNYNVNQKESGIFLKALEMISLSAINCILLVMYLPQVNVLVPVIMGAFVVYNIFFIMRALKPVK